MASKFFVFKDSSQDIHVINTSNIAIHGDLIARCSNFDQASVFNPVDVSINGIPLKGDILAISDSKIEMEEIRLKVLKEQINQPLTVNITSHLARDLSVASDILNNPTRDSGVSMDIHHAGEQGLQMMSNNINASQGSRILTDISNNFPGARNQFHSPSPARDSQLTTPLEYNHGLNDRYQSTYENSCDLSDHNAPHDATEEDEDQSVNQQSSVEESADDKLKDFSFSHESVKNILSELWKEVIDMKKKLSDISSAEKNNTDCIRIDKKYDVPKLIIARSLRESANVEIHCRNLIRRSWDSSEWKGKGINAGGKYRRSKIDCEKLKAFIHYSLTSWNDHHSSEKGNNTKVIHTYDMSSKYTSIRRSISQLLTDSSRAIHLRGEVTSRNS